MKRVTRLRRDAGRSLGIALALAIVSPSIVLGAFIGREETSEPSIPIIILAILGLIASVRFARSACLLFDEIAREESTNQNDETAR